MFNLFPFQTNNFPKSWSYHVNHTIYYLLWKVFQTSLEALIHMVETVDLHTKHPLLQSSPCIVIARVATGQFGGHISGGKYYRALSSCVALPMCELRHPVGIL